MSPRYKLSEPVCLVTPPSVFLLDERTFMTLGILKVAALLEQAGIDVAMVDLSGIENYEEKVALHAASSAAKIFGLTATTLQLPAAGNICRAIREARPDARISLGGSHVTLVNTAYKRERRLGIEGSATAAMTEIRGMFDVLVTGDGDEAIFRALGDDGPLLIDADDPASPLFLTNARLKELPLPARHLVDVDSYHYRIDEVRALSLIAQLGCPFACGPPALSVAQTGERAGVPP